MTAAGPRWGRRAGLTLALVAGFFALDALFILAIGEGRGGGGLFNRYTYQIVVSATVNVTLAVSLQLVNGIAGQFSIGHAGFMAIGGYGAAFFAREAGPLVDGRLPAAISDDVTYLAGLLVGMSLAAAAGLLVGIPSLRLRGDYLAIVTLGFGEIIRVAILSTDAVGGPRGFPGIPQWTTLAKGGLLAAAAVAVVWALSRSSFGRAMRAVREDEIAADAMGIDTTRTKVTAFVVSAALAGLAGGLFAHLFMYLHTNTFTFFKSFEIVMMIILGGLGSITGAVFGGIVMTALPEILRPMKEWRMVVYSLAIILIIRFRPAGLFGGQELSDLVGKARRAWRRA